jgi:hypothetical protein
MWTDFRISLLEESKKEQPQYIRQHLVELHSWIASIRQINHNLLMFPKRRGQIYGGEMSSLWLGLCVTLSISRQLYSTSRNSFYTIDGLIPKP